ncbi:hypothetical protein AW736_13520 [Termitidicoccus mucosus]|uniref:Uncharacterized protein n=1 Tax=Termitidicoccus mucosus TaxID=1184151 RepID=A0A178IH00_9BACT|nr:hypothetical protein AW736_13520 [Opitutaceae bacterium TSB47]
MQGISDAPIGLNQLSWERIVHLSAKALNGNVDEIGAGIELVPPNNLAEFDSTNYLARGAQEALQHREFASCEFDVSFAAVDFTAGKIEREIGVRLDVQTHAGTAAQNGIEASHELRDRKRLGQIVVSTEIQALDSLVEIAASRQEKHRDSVVGLTQLAQDAETVAPRQHDIHDQCVESLTRGSGCSRVTIMAYFDLETPFLKAGSHQRCDLLIIFYYEDTHSLVTACLLL